MSTNEPGPVVLQQQAAPPDHAGGSQPVLFPPQSDVREVERWYGGYTLMTDGLSLGAVIAGGIAENNGRGSGETFFWIAAGGYLLGAPIVHLAHENPGRAALSLGMRVAIPIAFFGTGVLIEGCPGGDFCGLPSLVIGVPLGMATAIALDASLVARDTVEESFTIAPTAMLNRNGGSIGVVGTF